MKPLLTTARLFLAPVMGCSPAVAESTTNLEKGTNNLAACHRSYDDTSLKEVDFSLGRHVEFKISPGKVCDGINAQSQNNNNSHALQGEEILSKCSVEENLTKDAPPATVYRQVTAVFDRPRFLTSLQGRNIESAWWCETTKRIVLSLEGLDTNLLSDLEALELLKRPMIKWCKQHPGEPLTPTVAQRQGFSHIEKPSITSDATATGIKPKKASLKKVSLKPWQIERIVLGDGAADKSKLLLGENVMYGSSSLHGGNESFYPILFHTLKVRRLSVSSTEAYQKTQHPSVIEDAFARFLNGKGQNYEVLDAVEAECLRNPGHPFVIGGPGARGYISNARQYRTHEFGNIFARSENGECVHASVINAIDRLCGRKRAEEAVSKANLVFLSSLSAAANWIKGLKCHVELRKVNREARHLFHARNMDKFNWIAHQKSGVFLVRIEQKGLVDHCVTVDADAGIILDSCDRLPLVLSVEALQLCGGSTASKLRIGEIREVVRQRGCDDSLHGGMGNILGKRKRV